MKGATSFDDFALGREIRECPDLLDLVRIVSRSTDRLSVLNTSYAVERLAASNVEQRERLMCVGAFETVATLCAAAAVRLEAGVETVDRSTVARLLWGLGELAQPEAHELHGAFGRQDAVQVCCKQRFCFLRNIGNCLFVLYTILTCRIRVSKS